ncbi:unnamed protein product [Prorocentrum cordatum]|uniref:Uncharacterized protein n=1 Tax=Prorocentrum cordatum TaxID=2364126 RepID=A0ABN9TZ96_9DINO|nr:unnamed protein product [Polarella glacialis]
MELGEYDAFRHWASYGADVQIGGPRCSARGGRAVASGGPVKVVELSAEMHSRGARPRPPPPGTSLEAVPLPEAGPVSVRFGRAPLGPLLGRLCRHRGAVHLHPALTWRAPEAKPQWLAIGNIVAEELAAQGLAQRGAAAQLLLNGVRSGEVGRIIDAAVSEATAGPEAGEATRAGAEARPQEAAERPAAKEQRRALEEEVLLLADRDLAASGPLAEEAAAQPSTSEAAAQPHQAQAELAAHEPSAVEAAAQPQEAAGQHVACEPAAAEAEAAAEARPAAPEEEDEDEEDNEKEEERVTAAEPVTTEVLAVQPAAGEPAVAEAEAAGAPEARSSARAAQGLRPRGVAAKALLRGIRSGEVGQIINAAEAAARPYQAQAELAADEPSAVEAVAQPQEAAGQHVACEPAAAEAEAAAEARPAAPEEERVTAEPVAVAVSAVQPAAGEPAAAEVPSAGKPHMKGAEALLKGIRSGEVARIVDAAERASQDPAAQQLAELQLDASAGDAPDFSHSLSLSASEPPKAPAAAGAPEARPSVRAAEGLRPRGKAARALLSGIRSGEVGQIIRAAEGQEAPSAAGALRREASGEVEEVSSPSHPPMSIRLSYELLAEEQEPSAAREEARVGNTPRGAASAAEVAGGARAASPQASGAEAPGAQGASSPGGSAAGAAGVKACAIRGPASTRETSAASEEAAGEREGEDADASERGAASELEGEGSTAGGAGEVAEGEGGSGEGEHGLVAASGQEEEEEEEEEEGQEAEAEGAESEEDSEEESEESSGSESESEEEREAVKDAGCQSPASQQWQKKVEEEVEAQAKAKAKAKEREALQAKELEAQEDVGRSPELSDTRLWQRQVLAAKARASEEDPAWAASLAGSLAAPGRPRPPRRGQVTLRPASSSRSAPQLHAAAQPCPPQRGYQPALPTSSLRLHAAHVVVERMHLSKAQPASPARAYQAAGLPQPEPPSAPSPAQLERLAKAPGPPAELPPPGRRAIGVPGSIMSLRNFNAYDYSQKLMPEAPVPSMLEALKPFAGERGALAARRHRKLDSLDDTYGRMVPEQSRSLPKVKSLPVLSERRSSQGRLVHRELQPLVNLYRRRPT